MQQRLFIADLIACSTCFGHHYAHHQELKSILQWLLPVVFRAVVFKLLVWYGAEGCVSGLQDAAASGDRIPLGIEIFPTRPDLPWGPPSLLYNGYRAFPGGKAAGA